MTHEAITECVTDVLTTFWRLLWSITKSDARQHVIYLFYIITKRRFYFKIFQHNAKAGRFAPPLPHLCTKNVIWRDLWSIQNEAISLIAMRSKELSLVEKNRTTVKPESSVAPLWMKTYSERRIKLQNLQILKKMLEKIKSVFVIGAALWAEKLGRCLENYRRGKITLGKLCGCGQPGCHLIRVLKERRVNDGG